MSSYELRVAAVREWLASARFEGVTRLHTARDVVEQQGTIETEYPIALHAAVEFYDRLRELFRRREQITTFGPYSPRQAVAMKRMGLEEWLDIWRAHNEWAPPMRGELRVHTPGSELRETARSG